MKKAVVVHSGGMDSSICLALASREFGPAHVVSLSFDYDQRHQSELAAAAKICKDWGIDHRQITTDILRQVTNNALTDASKEIRSSADTLVVGRNGLMARLSSIYANGIGARCIYMGVLGIEVDYRDCSREYMDLMQQILRIDLADPEFEIRTPLVAMTKAETLHLANQMGVLEYLLENTVTCYRGIPKEGCGDCPACCLKRRGLQQYQASLAFQS